MPVTGWDAFTSDEEVAAEPVPIADPQPPLGALPSEAVVPTHPTVRRDCEGGDGILGVVALRAVVPDGKRRKHDTIVASPTDCNALLLPTVGGEVVQASVQGVLHSKDRTSTYESTLKTFATKKTSLTFPSRQAMALIRGHSSASHSAEKIEAIAAAQHFGACAFHGSILGHCEASFRRGEFSLLGTFRFFRQRLHDVANRGNDLR